MTFEIQLLLAFIITSVTTWVVTPYIRKLAFKIGATDQPNARKTHVKIMPRLGGLGIVIGVGVGLLIIQPDIPNLTAIVFGGLVITAVGVLDDLYTIRPIVKLSGQVIAAGIVVASGLTIDYITLPIVGLVDFGAFSFIITFIWIIGVTNAINLIDGLDGLAAGISIIGLSSMFVISVIDGELAVMVLTAITIGPALGFLYHNFYPAKIFMGDTGALFLGYVISVISVQGLFKNVTIFSFLLPVIVIAVPIFDTLFAIIRRKLNGQRIGDADKKHIHHKLIAMGYSHRATVLILYGFSAFFGLMAIVYSSFMIQISMIVLVLVLFGIQLIAEMTGILDGRQKPITSQIKKIRQLFKRS
jgi:UDP-GlcNAc:undecaprenyl-phosphate GlcNAc-1-phosphate transferase